MSSYLRGTNNNYVLIPLIVYDNQMVGNNYKFIILVMSLFEGGFLPVPQEEGFVGQIAH